MKRSKSRIYQSDTYLYSVLMFSRVRNMMQLGSSNSRSAHCNYTYEDALKALGSLQSNLAYIRAAALRDSRNDTDKLQTTEKYLLRSGLTFEQLDKLSVIHVAGTKGKGSTCAFTESILREHGYKTGFFSSPHLITVRERLRINGSPINELEFTRYFWRVYNVLYDRKTHDSDMPTYFIFLTILMFHVFLSKRVDVAIIEVGIGGEKDCTNIIRNPVCVGVSSLGIDHVILLGNTIEQIAYEKAGIFKTNTVAFTVPQPEKAMEVLRNRAKEKSCELSVVPPLECYFWKSEVPTLGIACDIQKQNASLAIQLSRQWISHKIEEKSLSIKSNLSYEPNTKIFSENILKDDEKSSDFSLVKVANALKNCKWPGRTQILHGKSIDFYLDGAHTIESVQSCASWFHKHTKDCECKRILVFNCTGNRDSSKMLKLLKSMDFTKAYFVPNVSGVKSPDHIENVNQPVDEQIIKCRSHSEIWGPNSRVMTTVKEVLDDIKQESEQEKVKLLFTGSLYLVGAALEILDPNLSMKTDF